MSRLDFFAWGCCVGYVVHAVVRMVEDVAKARHDVKARQPEVREALD